MPEFPTPSSNVMLWEFGATPVYGSVTEAHVQVTVVPLETVRDEGVK
jgi:hypothetical protein